MHSEQGTSRNCSSVIMLDVCDQASSTCDMFAYERRRGLPGLFARKSMERSGKPVKTVGESVPVRFAPAKRARKHRMTLHLAPASCKGQCLLQTAAGRRVCPFALYVC